MASPEFDPARARIERAAQHAREMSEVWNDYLVPHPFDFTMERDSDRSFVLKVIQREPVPTSLSVLFGEYLYNLRSALDYVVWALAVHTSRQQPPPGESGLQYPIYDDEAAWKRNLWRLNPLLEHHRAMLLTMQPFSSDLDANFLGWINRLARIDRHRTLAVSTARVAEAEPVLQAPSSSDPQLSWGERVLHEGVCSLLRVTFSRPVDGDEVSINPRAGIDPEIAEWAASEFWGRSRFSERLQMLRLFVGMELTIYEYDATGDSPQQESLTASFRAESDARRAAGKSGPIVRPTHPPVRWTATDARPSNKDRFAGRDFPSDGAGPVAR
jgi:hypothetical protein